MIDISPEIFTLALLGSIALGIVIGYPLGFVLGTIGLVAGYLIYGSAVVQLFYWHVTESLFDYIKLAIPLFVYMGAMLAYSGLAEKMYDAFFVWLGGLRGGLAVITILIGTILATSVGIIAASITMLSLVAIPSMMKYGYKKSLASASVCAGGCLGILIPPSVMLVVYGPIAQISVGQLFFGAFIPGFILSLFYCSYVLVYSFLNPHVAPSVSVDEIEQLTFGQKTVRLITAVGPAGLLILSVLGVIFVGIAPPSEAAAIGALVATLMCIAYRKFTWRILINASLETVRLSGFVFLIIATATVFSSAFMGGGGGDVVMNMVLSIGGGRWGAFAVIIGAVFILGFLMDWIGIVLILVPIVTPIGAALGFHPVWFAIMICVCLQTGYMTPPFAMGIFITKGSIPPEFGVTTGDVIRGVIPFVIMIICALTLFCIFPELITWLPGQMIRPGG